LVEVENGAAMLTIPLRSAEGMVGALTLERFKGAPFRRAERSFGDALGMLLGPLMALQSERLRPLRA
jgi:hypothetical protein